MSSAALTMHLRELCHTVLAAAEPEFKKLAPIGARLRAKPMRVLSKGDAKLLVLASAPVPHEPPQLRVFCAAVHVYEGESSRIVLSRARRIVERLALNLSEASQQVAL